MEELRKYLEDNLTQGKIDHALRAEIDPATGGIKFYIHPHGVDGMTADIFLPPLKPLA